MYNFIYLFHMPLFIFISGRFSHVKTKVKYKEGILRLLETYLVFQMIRTTVETLFGQKLSIACLFIPNYMLWYLVALIYWRLFIYFMPESWHTHKKRILCVSLIIFSLAGFVPIGYPFVIQRTLTFQFFFLLGYYSVYIDIKKSITRIPTSLAMTFLLATFGFLFFVVDRSLGYVHHCSIPYWTTDSLHTMYRFISRCIYLPIAVFLCISIMKITPPQPSCVTKIMSRWGKNTMFIFIYHSFFLREILFPLISMKVQPSNEIFLIGYTVFTIVLLMGLTRINALVILLNPISYIRNKYL